MPLRARLSLIVAVAVALLLAVSGSIFVRQLRVGLDQAMDTALRTRADLVLQQLESTGTANFQDPGVDALLPPDQALTQVVGRVGVTNSSDGARAGPLLSSSQLARARHQPVSLTSDYDGVSVRLLAVTVPGTGSIPTVLVVGATRTIPAEAVSRVQAALLVGGSLAVVVSAAGVWLLAGAALRPVARMRSQAELITAGDLQARLPVPKTRDEVARLGRTLNSLLQRLHRALRQQQAFVADAGHELRTPLTVLRAELELAARPNRSRAELDAAIRRAAEDTDRLVRLAEDLLLLARADATGALLTLTRFSLSEAVQQAVASAQIRAGEGGVRIVVDAPSPIEPRADADRVRQVLDNLLDNALRFAPRNSTVTVRVTRSEPEHTHAVVTILDDGPGFPSAFLPYAFERFRRADASRTDPSAGTGLGLAIVASIVHAHGGEVTAQNRTAGGAELRVVLPLAGPKARMYGDNT